MAQSSQAKEVILEIGTAESEQTYSVQVQSGTVSKQIFDTCQLSSGCYTGIVNTNSDLSPFGDWHRMDITSVKQAGNSPSVYPGGGVNPSHHLYTPGASMIYAFDYNYDGNANEANIIIFQMSTSSGANPEFNGIEYSNDTPPGFTPVNNLRVDGRDRTEQGRMLYLKPKDPNEYDTNISFEILEGAEEKLAVRGPGGMSIGEYLHNNGFAAQTINELNEIGFFSRFDAYISPYVHEGNWEYDASGRVSFDSSIKTIHASYAPSPNNNVNFASIVKEKGAFGVRSTASLFDCFETWTQGYNLDITISSMTNCSVDVLTYTSSPVDDYALDYAGINQNGTDWVYETIKVTGNHIVCVPYHYNTIDTEESQNQYMAGLGGGWSTAVQVQTGGGGFLAGNIAQKRFYNNQYKFIKVNPIDDSQPYGVTFEKFELKNAGYNMRTIQVPTYINQTIKVPSYTYDFLDVFDRDKVPVALTFNSGDLKDPSKRSTGYSKTFELPASNRNQRILKSLTGIGSHRSADDISWRKARISSNGIVVFNGFARIEQSNTAQGGRYSCHILQDPSYWPELIGDSELCELTFSEHIKSYDTVVSSWSNNVDNIPYVYPAINYGEWSKDSNSTQQHHSIADFHPATYVKAIVDSIFSGIGYTIDSNFFNTEIFKKLIIPYTSGDDYNVTQGDALGEDGNYSSQASLAAEDGNFPNISATGFNINLTKKFRPVIPCQNGCANYSPGSYNSIQNGYTVPFTGRFTVHYQAQLWLKTAGIAGNGNPGRWAAWLYVNGQTVGPYNLNQPNAGDQGYAFGDNDTGGPPGFNYVGAPSVSWFEDDSNGSWQTDSFTTTLDLNQGDTVQVGFLGIHFKDLYKLEGKIRDQDFAVWPVADQAYVPPAPVSLSQALGCGVKQIDFLKGITELFNLYWTADNDSKVVSVEPYDSFYGSGKIVDWSQKVDRKGWSDRFLIDELAKTVTFKYKKDSSDSIVERYNESMNTELWSYEQTNNDLYRKENSTLGTTIFSPTFRLRNTPGDGDLTFVNSGQAPVMPCMWGGDVNWGWFNGTSRPENKTDFNIRILNWYGLSNDVGSWTLTDDNGNPQTKNVYPYAHTYNYNHNGVGALENNLSWYGIGASANTYQRGLFDRFYGRLYEKISGGAALRTCMMDLTHVDISQFDFRNIIKINQDGKTPTYWTVNKIIDFAPGKDVLTKVELIEWKYGFYLDKDGKVVGYNSSPTNYAGIGSSGSNPNGGHGVVTGTGGQNITIQDNGVYYIEPTEALPTKSNKINISNNVTTELLLSNPTLPNNMQQFSDKVIESNQYNGLSNNPAINDATHNNNITKNGIALGVGLNATANQTILGSFNQFNGDDAFQVGGGYHDSRTGDYKRVNALSVSKDGDFSVFGGEVVAEFSTKDYSITGDVYYTDQDGVKRKVYLKNRINNR
tara:strand:- start:12976 stop:17253 length:4278 start_codon:yes stop_codon:yes gene_type:complete